MRVTRKEMERFLDECIRDFERQAEQQAKECDRWERLENNQQFRRAYRHWEQYEEYAFAAATILRRFRSRY